MRILYHISELDIGGAERMLYALATGLAERGHQIEVACLTGHGKVGDWLTESGIKVHYLEASLSRPQSLFLPLGRVLKEFRPDVLHNFLFHANMVGRFNGWLTGVPAVVCAVRVEDVERKFRLWLDGATHWMMHAQTCVSESAARFTHQASHIPTEKLVAVPNCIDVSRYENVRGTLREELSIGPETPLLLTVGRLSRQKGLPHLLDAFKLILGEFNDGVLVIAGAGEEEAALKTQVNELGIGDGVKFIGWRAEVPSLLADADIFVLSSLWEGMPNVVLEAMASSKPVVATDVGGTPELVLNNETGLLVASQDPKALAQAITALLNSPGLRHDMGIAGKQRALDEFSPTRMIERNLDLYQHLLASRDRAAKDG